MSPFEIKGCLFYLRLILRYVGFQGFLFFYLDDIESSNADDFLSDSDFFRNRSNPPPNYMLLFTSVFIWTALPHPSTPIQLTLFALTLTSYEK